MVYFSVESQIGGGGSGEESGLEGRMSSACKWIAFFFFLIAIPRATCFALSIEFHITGHTASSTR